MTYYCGVFARDDRDDFTEEDVRSLERLRELVFDHLVLRAFFETNPTGGDVVAAVLDAFDAPAFMLSESGAVIHTNQAARSCYQALPEWLGSILSTSEDRAHPMARQVRLELDGRPVHLVAERSIRAPRARLTSLKLPRRLLRIAQGLANGYTDKEIATRTGLSHATVRTYVRELYQRTGVRGRVDLLRKLVNIIPDISGNTA